MKYPIALLLFCLSKMILGQIRPEKYYFSDTLYSKRSIKWDNGKTKVSYARKNDTILIRTDYYKSGSVKCQFEALYKWQYDTTASEKVDQPGVFDITVDSGYVDHPYGKYTAYDEYTAGITAEGILDYSTQIGKWKLINGNFEQSIINFDAFGRPDGEYLEYYMDGGIKWRGQYAVVKTIEYAFDSSFSIKQIPAYMGTKTGVWYHYNEKGVLLETVTYDWKIK
jgi:antitoxin component YwqK of YwqJK toxin-antitoxin module